MKTRIFILGLLVILTIIAVSCAPAPTPAPTAAPPTKAPEAPKPTTAPTTAPAPAGPSQAMLDAAKKEGQVISYGMSDDWVNLENIWKAIEKKYSIKHTDTDMTSAEQITKLLAEKNAPVMDVADIGYDFLGKLLENNLAMSYQNANWDKIPAEFKDPGGRWAVAYWGAISFLVNTDVIKNPPQTWADLLKPEYKDKVCSRDPAVSTYATGSVLAAAYANGGGEDNVKPGLDWFKQLRDSGNLRAGVVLNVAAVQKGECPISLVYDFDGFAKRDATKLPLQVIIPKDGTVGMLFAEYINAVAPHPNAAKLTQDFLFSDEGQIMFAQGYAHPGRKDVKLPDDVAKKMLPESAYGKLYFPKSLPSFSKAINDIVTGWNAIKGAAAPAPTIPQAMLDAAKKEANLVSYGLPDDWLNYGGVWKVMESKYGIKHKDTDMSSGEIIAALKAEKTAPVADITDLGYNFAQTVNDNDLAMVYKHAYWNDVPDYAKDKDGRWSSAAWGAIAFMVNTDKVKNVPRKWDDLLKPEYKDTICMKDPRSSATANMVVLAAAIAKGGDEKNVKPGLDFFKQLRAGGAMRPVSLSTSTIQKGECPIALFWDFDGLSRKRDLKMNLEIVIPSDGSVAGMYIQFIAKNAPHPNAAKLMLETMFSDEGQLSYANGFVHPTRTTVKIPDDLKKQFPPDDAYKVVKFPKDFVALDAAAKAISDGWAQLVQ
jgi:putative spermidine/putrescine transport system substrate-binding protein